MWWATSVLRTLNGTHREAKSGILSKHRGSALGRDIGSDSTQKERKTRGYEWQQWGVSIIVLRAGWAVMTPGNSIKRRPDEKEWIFQSGKAITRTVEQRPETCRSSDMAKGEGIRGKIWWPSHCPVPTRRETTDKTDFRQYWKSIFLCMWLLGASFLDVGRETLNPSCLAHQQYSWTFMLMPLKYLHRHHLMPAQEWSSQTPTKICSSSCT